jgi:prepilin-type N-terminal cleavage/methylation domain-containing protein
MREPTRRAIGGRHQRGFTLIELTVVLAVIVTLALILTPSVTGFISESRQARARTDCQMIAGAVVQFYRDTGFFPQWALSQAGGPGTPPQRLMVLVTPGTAPLEDPPSLWTTGAAGLLSDQVMTNAPGYTMRTVTSQMGWNGPYLTSELRSDPWGNRYLVNIGLVETSAGVMNQAGQMKAAVWVLSAGPNRMIETPFTQPVTLAVSGGDDIAFRIQ